jgi:hypothetical protein
MTETLKIKLHDFLKEQIQATANLKPAMTQFDAVEKDETPEDEIEARTLMHQTFDYGYVTGIHDVISYVSKLDIEIEVTRNLENTQESEG